MIKRVAGGIRVDDEALAVDDIHSVGPFGDFLSLDSTYRHMRDLSQPEILDRRTREDWQERGSKDLYTEAVSKARDIVEEHRPEPLPDDVAARIRAIVEETDRVAGAACLRRGKMAAEPTTARRRGRPRAGAQEAQEGAVPLRPGVLHDRGVHQPRHHRRDGGIRRRPDVLLARLPHRRVPDPLRHDHRRDGVRLPRGGRTVRVDAHGVRPPGRLVHRDHLLGLEPRMDRRHPGGHLRGGHQQPDPQPSR